MKRILCQRKNSSIPVNPSKQLLGIKLFPLPSNRDYFQKHIETYCSFTHQEIKKICSRLIEIRKFKQLVCNTLQLEYLYDPIITILREEYDLIEEKIKIGQILEILIEGKFFRKIAKEAQSTLFSSKSTHTNVQCLIAGIIAYTSGKLNLLEIERILKVFQFEEKSSQAQPFGISIDNQKIMKILKKLQRTIKPMDFKQWIEDFKKSKDSENIQNYQFLYLVTLTQPKIDENSYTFMDLNKNKNHKATVELNEISKDQNQIKKNIRDQNTLDHNQKYRIRCFSYQKNRQTLPVVTAFTDIKNQLHATEDKLKEKKKCMSLFGRINNRQQNNNQRDPFKQIHTTENLRLSSQYSSKCQLIQKKLLPERKKIIKNLENKENDIAQIINHKISENKENKIYGLEMPMISIKDGRKVLNAVKTKKLVLNEDEYKISSWFKEIYDCQQKKIENLMTEISSKNE